MYYSTLKSVTFGGNMYLKNIKRKGKRFWWFIFNFKPKIGTL